MRMCLCLQMNIIFEVAYPFTTLLYKNKPEEVRYQPDILSNEQKFDHNYCKDCSNKTAGKLVHWPKCTAG